MLVKNKWNIYRMRSYSSSFIILSPLQVQRWIYLESRTFANRFKLLQGLGSKVLVLVFPLTFPASSMSAIEWCACSLCEMAVFFHTICYSRRLPYSSECLCEWIGKDKNSVDLPSRDFLLSKSSCLDLCTLVTILAINISSNYPESYFWPQISQCAIWGYNLLFSKNCFDFRGSRKTTITQSLKV